MKNKKLIKRLILIFVRGPITCAHFIYSDKEHLSNAMKMSEHVACDRYKLAASLVFHLKAKKEIKPQLTIS